jgi:hypothetical protein
VTEQETAETVALRALAWLAGNDELLPVFLNATGADLTDLRARATDSAFLGSVLDFLLMDDAWVVGFCDTAALPYDTPMHARQILAGTDRMNWT